MKSYLFLLLFTVLSVLFSGPEAVSAMSRKEARTSPQPYAQADICSVGSSYRSGCCCAAVNPNPVTKLIKSTKYLRKTKTVTVTARNVGRRNSLEIPRDLPEQEAVEVDGGSVRLLAEQAAVIPPHHDQLVGRLYPRHLCPVCPAGVVLGDRKNKNNDVIWCCAKRRTVSITKVTIITQTVRKTITKTTPPPPNVVNSNFALSNNNTLSVQGTAQPGSKITLYARPVARLQNRGLTVLGITFTNAKGTFTIVAQLLGSGQWEILIVQTSIFGVESPPTTVGFFNIPAKIETTANVVPTTKANWATTKLQVPATTAKLPPQTTAKATTAPLLITTKAAVVVPTTAKVVVTTAKATTVAPISGASTMTDHTTAILGTTETPGTTETTKTPTPFTTEEITTATDGPSTTTTAEEATTAPIPTTTASSGGGGASCDATNCAGGCCSGTSCVLIANMNNTFCGPLSTTSFVFGACVNCPSQYGSIAFICTTNPANAGAGRPLGSCYDDT